MITLKVKPASEYLEIESVGAVVKCVSVLGPADEDGQIVVRLRLIMGKDSFYPQTAGWIAVWNGKKSESFDAHVVSIDFDSQKVEFMVEMTLDKLMFLVSPIWRDFVRDSIVKFREQAFSSEIAR